MTNEEPELSATTEPRQSEEARTVDHAHMTAQTRGAQAGTTAQTRIADDAHAGEPEVSAAQPTASAAQPEASAAEPEVSAAELTERLMRVAHLIRRGSMANLAELNLTPAQSRALRTISKADPPIRMGELASTLGVVPRSATGLVDALEEAGLVARTVDPANRRSVLVTTTQGGRDVQAAMARARVAAGDGLFGALDTQERRALADLLGKLAPADGPGGRR